MTSEHLMILLLSLIIILLVVLIIALADVANKTSRTHYRYVEQDTSNLWDVSERLKEKHELIYLRRKIELIKGKLELVEGYLFPTGDRHEDQTRK